MTNVLKINCGLPNMALEPSDRGRHLMVKFTRPKDSFLSNDYENSRLKKICISFMFYFKVSLSKIGTCICRELM